MAPYNMLGLNVDSESSFDTSSLDTTAAYVSNHNPFATNRAFRSASPGFLEQMEINDFPSFGSPSPAHSGLIRHLAPLPRTHVPTPIPAHVVTPVPASPCAESTGQFVQDPGATTPVLARALTLTARNIAGTSPLSHLPPLTGTCSSAAGRVFTRSASVPLSLSTPLRRSSPSQLLLPSTTLATPVLPVPLFESTDGENSFTPPQSTTFHTSVQLTPADALSMSADMESGAAIPRTNEELSSEGHLTPHQPKRTREDEPAAYLPQETNSNASIAKCSDVPLHMQNKRARFTPPPHHSPSERELQLNASRQYRLIWNKRKYQAPANAGPPREGAHMGSYSEAERQYIYACRANVTWDLVAHRPWWLSEDELMRRALPAVDKATGMTGANFVDKTFQDTV